MCLRMGQSGAGKIEAGPQTPLCPEKCGAAPGGCFRAIFDRDVHNLLARNFATFVAIAEELAKSLDDENAGLIASTT